MASACLGEVAEQRRRTCLGAAQRAKTDAVHTGTTRKSCPTKTPASTEVSHESCCIAGSDTPTPGEDADHRAAAALFQVLHPRPSNSRRVFGQLVLSGLMAFLGTKSRMVHRSWFQNSRRMVANLAFGRFFPQALGAMDLLRGEVFCNVYRDQLVVV